jgi:hypothetical protein
MTANSAQYENGPIPIDGGWFAVVDGEWRQVPHPNLPTSAAAPPSTPRGEFEKGPISVDGAWLAVVDDEWKQVGYATPGDANPRRTIPEGYVSVDGALLPVELPHLPSTATDAAPGNA